MKHTFHIKVLKTPFFLRMVFCVLVAILPFSSATSQKKKAVVQLKHTDVYKVNKAIGEDYQILIGHVQFIHEGTVMYCDSAVLNQKNNSFDAFKNVHIIQGDTLNIYSDVLYYDGNTKMARLRKNVRMINRETTLTTEKLNYDMNTEVGYYFDGGQIQDTINTIVSETGHYYPQLDNGYFHNDVVVTTPDMKMYTDTMKYNTEIKMVSILGPTTITNDTTTLYAENGYYKSIEKYAFIYDNATITQESYLIKGDTLTYDQYTHDSYAFGSVYMQDTTQRMIITGNYGFFNDSTSHSLVTDSAVMMMYNSMDTLFLHADTLASAPDTTDNNIIKAYYNVRFYKSDLQGKCDSLALTMMDTVIHMHYDPIVWSTYNQLSGDVIEVFQKNGETDRIKLTNNAFMASMEDSVRYNQIKGKTITAKVEMQQLRRIDVDGNAQSVYYTKDGPYIIGMNKAESAYLIIFLLDSSVEKIIMHPQPTGRLYPNKNIQPSIETLEGFMWFKYLRPKGKWDIF